MCEYTHSNKFSIFTLTFCLSGSSRVSIDLIIAVVAFWTNRLKLAQSSRLEVNFCGGPPLLINTWYWLIDSKTNRGFFYYGQSRSRRVFQRRKAFRRNLASQSQQCERIRLSARRCSTIHSYHGKLIEKVDAECSLSTGSVSQQIEQISKLGRAAEHGYWEPVTYGGLQILSINRAY